MTNVFSNACIMWTLRSWTLWHLINCATQLWSSISHCILIAYTLHSLFFFSPSAAGDGVLSAGECHAALKGAAGAEDQNDPG